MCGTFTAQPGQRDALIDVLLDAARLLGEMDECQVYLVGTVDDEPDAVAVLEVWSDRDAHARSLQDPRVQELIQRGRPLIAGMGQSLQLNAVGGKAPTSG